MANSATKDAATRRAARKAENHGAKRARILEVAGEMFYRQGYGNTSIDEIAAELGVGKPFIYYYFRDKLTIFETLCIESSNLTHKAFEASRDAGLTPPERLSQGLNELILRYLQTFAGGALYYKEPGLLAGEAKEIVRSHALSLHADLLQVLEDGRASGDFYFEDTKLTALMIGGAIGFMFTWYRPGSETTSAELAQYMVRDLMKIVQTPAAKT